MPALDQRGIVWPHFSRRRRVRSWNPYRRVRAAPTGSASCRKRDKPGPAAASAGDEAIAGVERPAHGHALAQSPGTERRGGPHVPARKGRCAVVGGVPNRPPASTGGSERRSRPGDRTRPSSKLERLRPRTANERASCDGWARARQSFQAPASRPRSERDCFSSNAARLAGVLCLRVV
jgi:hypothetical protein